VVGSIRVAWLVTTLSVVAMAAACTGGGHPTAPTVPTPQPPSSVATAPSSPGPRAHELQGPNARIRWVLYAGPLHAVAGWDVCPVDPRSLGPCRSLWTQTHDGWASSVVRADPDGAIASLASDGTVALWAHRFRLALLDADGQTRRVRVVLRPRPARVDEPIFGSNLQTSRVATDLWAYDAAHNRAHPVPPAPHITTRFSAVRAPDGRLWVVGWGSRQNVWVAWSDDGGRTWTEHLVTRFGYSGGLALGAPGQVAVFARRADATDKGRRRSAITYDNGRSWERLDLAEGPGWVGSEGIIGGPGGVATTDDGALFVVDFMTNTLWTSTGDWREFRRVPRAGRVGWIQSNGGLLWAGHTGHRVRVSADGGRTWQGVVPG